MLPGELASALALTLALTQAQMPVLSLSKEEAQPRRTHSRASGVLAISGLGRC